jgi:predicted nucleic acid-binding protein
MPGEFADSNVLLYLTSDDVAKAEIAQHLLAARPVISVQVLNEIANVVRRKFGRSWTDVRALLDRVEMFVEVRDLTRATHRRALAIAEHYRTSWWDALIVAAALEAGCETLYSEDLHTGLVIDARLTVVNPFA